MTDGNQGVLYVQRTRASLQKSFDEQWKKLQEDGVADEHESKVLHVEFRNFNDVFFVTQGTTNEADFPSIEIQVSLHPWQATKVIEFLRDIPAEPACNDE